jgi:hypothetical protein
VDRVVETVDRVVDTVGRVVDTVGRVVKIVGRVVIELAEVIVTPVVLGALVSITASTWCAVLSLCVPYFDSSVKLL